MGEIFFKVLHMSLLGSIAVLWALLVRFPLKRLPKVFSYVLWLIVFIRFICPFSLEGNFSLIPLQRVEQGQESQWVDPFYTTDEAVIKVLYGLNTEGAKVDDEIALKQDLQQHQTNLEQQSNHQIDVLSQERYSQWLNLAGLLWGIGMLLFTYKDMSHYLKLRNQLKESEYIGDKVYRYKGQIPFTFGLIAPKIYLPYGVEEEEATYIIQHEEVHIKRGDHIVKIVATAIVNIHWFNPLIWIAFSKMSQDMELSCDEKVVKQSGNSIKKVYANLLLKHATSMDFKTVLMFGKHPIEERVTHILNYKKAKRWKYLVAGILIGIVGMGVMAQTMQTTQKTNDTEQIWENRLEDKGTPLALNEANVLPEYPIGVQGVSLDYASESHIIFHDYFGLFVYNLKEERISHSLDLEAIGCQWMQGDDYCEVTVNQEGDIILLHPMSADWMVVYDLAQNTLTKSQVEPLNEPFKCEENPHPGGGVSYQVVTLSNGEIGYLSFMGETVKDITYHDGHKEYRVFPSCFL